MPVDSGTVSVERETRVYASCEPSDPDAWQHTGANYYAWLGLGLDLQVTEGHYVGTPSAAQITPSEGLLNSEFAAWEAASDEALALFEAELG
jgi:hypothetical protein